jgi:hypothetical protein
MSEDPQEPWEKEIEGKGAVVHYCLSPQDPDRIARRIEQTGGDGKEFHGAFQELAKQARTAGATGQQWLAHWKGRYGKSGEALAIVAWAEGTADMGVGLEMGGAEPQVEDPGCDHVENDERCGRTPTTLVAVAMTPPEEPVSFPSPVGDWAETVLAVRTCEDHRP